MAKWGTTGRRYRVTLAGIEKPTRDGVELFPWHQVSLTGSGFRRRFAGMWAVARELTPAQQVVARAAQRRTFKRLLRSDEFEVVDHTSVGGERLTMIFMATCAWMLTIMFCGMMSAGTVTRLVQAPSPLDAAIAIFGVLVLACLLAFSIQLSRIARKWFRINARAMHWRRVGVKWVDAVGRERIVPYDEFTESQEPSGELRSCIAIRDGTQIICKRPTRDAQLVLELARPDLYAKFFPARELSFNWRKPPRAMIITPVLAVVTMVGICLLGQIPVKDIVLMTGFALFLFALVPVAAFKQSKRSQPARRRRRRLVP